MLYCHLCDRQNTAVVYVIRVTRARVVGEHDIMKQNIAYYSVLQYIILYSNFESGFRGPAKRTKKNNTKRQGGRTDQPTQSLRPAFPIRPFTTDTCSSSFSSVLRAG